MSGVVSYELFAGKFGTSGFTTEGGIYETFVNKTGDTSVKGTIVAASTTTDNAVYTAPASSTVPIGIIYESGIADGSPVKVVVYGKAQVLLVDSTGTSSNGFWCGVSSTPGRMYQASTAPTDVSEHSCEIGHSLESKASGTNVLALIQVHFN